MNLADLKSQAGLGSWHFQCDNPTILGWSVVGTYGIAALGCVAAGLHARSRSISDSKRGHAGIWWALALALAFLGANKQLNLQSMMIAVMRHVALNGGWVNQRRSAQLLFCLAFGLALVGVLFWLALRHREFFKLNPPALWGVIILGVFVALRAATINHADEFLRVNLRDGQWAWVLEIAGSVLVGIAAARQTRGKHTR
jgi:hypothetical protein